MRQSPVVGHFALLWATDPELAQRAPKGAVAYMSAMHYDTALSANPHALSSLAELVEWDHVLFGSDYPFAPEIATQLSIMSLDGDSRFTPPARSMIRSSNALGLFERLGRGA